MSITDDCPSQLTPLQKRDWVAAHILYTNNILAALAGPPAAAFYGSDTLWVRSILLVTDSSFQSARNILQANGYKDASMDPSDFQMVKPPDVAETVEWRLLSRGGMTITLVPASHWHFEITDDTTIIVDGMRLPKFSSYLHALVSIIGERVQSSAPTGYYVLQAMNILVLREKYPNSMIELSTADRFFSEHFFPLKKRHNCRKVAELWDALNHGKLTAEEAVALAPIEKPLKYQRTDFPVISIKLATADEDQDTLLAEPKASEGL